MPGSTAVAYTSVGTTPLTASQVVEWLPQHLPGVQVQAIQSLVRFVLDINKQDFVAAWHGSTGRYDRNPSAFSLFQEGYRTTRFYQLAFGPPKTLGPDLVAVPLRFVSRQNGAAQGDASIPSCVFWPQFVYLIGKRSGHWLPDDANAYKGSPGVGALERTGADGVMHLNPRAQESRC